MITKQTGNEIVVSAAVERRYPTAASEISSRYRYTGQYEYSELGLYFYQSRWYDAALGRFAQADTIVPLATQGVQALDRYAYVNNSPLNFVDPTGRDLEQILFNKRELPKPTNKTQVEQTGGNPDISNQNTGCNSVICLPTPTPSSPQIWVPVTTTQDTLPVLLSSGPQNSAQNQDANES